MKNTNTKKVTVTKTVKEYKLKENAWKYFINQGLAPSDHSGWALHHIDISLKDNDPVRYHQWRVSDLIPMTVQDHRSYHMSLQSSHKPLTKEHREKISSGIQHSELKNKKVVITLTTNLVFDTISDAAKYIGCSKQLVSQCLRPNRTNKKAKGYTITLV